MSGEGDPRPRVTVVSLGGTIASAPGPGTSYASPRLAAEDLVESVPELAQLAVLSVRNIGRLPSCDLTLNHALLVADEIRTAVDEGAEGIVVTQGTDTIEEMSFALDLLLAGDVPVVMTGAMRHAGLTGADGPANLLDAVRTAISAEAGGLGCLVVLNEEVHAAAVVRKTHTSSPAAFRSPTVGPVGWLAEGTAHLASRPVPLVRVYPQTTDLPRVPLVKITIGDDGWWVDAVRSAAASGLVLEAMGGGHLPEWLAAPVAELARRFPVVLTSRTGDGEVLRSTYGGFPGSESALLRAGLIPGGFLPALKARVLLTLLLSAGATGDQIREAFDLLGRPRRPTSDTPALLIGRPKATTTKVRLP